jgi:NADPH:quinone reductase-like Zn-dependent oxidoreductase
MRALAVTAESQPPMLREDMAQPVPGFGELLIRVCAAGVILTELQWYPTTHTSGGANRESAVLGHELSGIVEAAGPCVGSLEVGREVYGLNDWFSDGAMAEYCVAPFFAVAPKPRHLSHTEAASVPISALTAWQGLFDRAKLNPGETVLVHGGTGAVGMFVAQLARRHGAHVIATASGANADLALSLGAEQVIDYRASRFEDTVKDIDVVFDTVGGDTLARSWSVLKPNGRMITIVSEPANASDPRAAGAFFIVEPNQKQLVEIAELLDTGQIRTLVDSVVPLSEAPKVYADPGKKRRGKVVVEVSDN